MDVHCSSCGEPWDVWHLCHDAIHETDLSEEEIERWLDLPQQERLGSSYRDYFAREGWRFGSSILSVRSCPCCPDGATPNPDTDVLKEAIVSMLGDDIDAIAAEFSDLGL